VSVQNDVGTKRCPQLIPSILKKRKIGQKIASIHKYLVIQNAGGRAGADMEVVGALPSVTSGKIKI
jgi:hypothetical protein